MKFSKMHGIGNDYVYVDTARERINDPAALAREMSPRHTGIGADGLILVTPPSKAGGAHVGMRMFNADGSESEMCGNGVRCVTKFAVDRGIARENPLRVETGRGTLEMKWTAGSDGRVSLVEVDMGAPTEGATRVPWPRSEWEETLGRARVHVDPRWIELAGVESPAWVVSMGNPHIVFWVKAVDQVPLATVGGAVERHPRFPSRINVHFVEVLSPCEVRMRTWERGSGITQACGTGASAVCAVGAADGRLTPSVLAHLPGGDLSLRLDEKTRHVHMTGPATHVFDGEWPS